MVHHDSNGTLVSDSFAETKHSWSAANCRALLVRGSILFEGVVLEHLVRDVEQGIHLCHRVTAPSHRSCYLLLKATRGVTIAVVSSRERKRRQPGLATDDPAFVGRHQ